jgi:hypothetical protein
MIIFGARLYYKGDYLNLLAILKLAIYKIYILSFDICELFYIIYFWFSYHLKNILALNLGALANALLF